MKDISRFDILHHKKTEVLAPAGTYSSLKAALNAGADAVYAGGSRFGARAYAGNLDHDEMIKAIDLTHLYGRKIYMTVNTLLFENEADDLPVWIRDYYEEGLDGVIVQDMGVIRILHEEFPDMELHASTQMTVMTGDSGKILHDRYGVTRLVPARELDINDLRELRRSTDLDLEVFVHGALCYSVSGQCMLSRMRGRRSGNRGSCAGSCRLLYEVPGGERKYILSTKENCGLFYLGDLINTGIDSLKIEGRMKRPEYVAHITSVYKKYTDIFYEKGYDGYLKYIEENKKDVKKDILGMADLYNRNGFTDTFFSETGVSHNFSRENDENGIFADDAGTGTAAAGRKPKTESSENTGAYLPDRYMLSDSRPSHGGICAGIVTAVDKKDHTFTYRCTMPLNHHDVVEVRDQRKNTVYEYTLKDPASENSHVTARYKSGCVIKEGYAVFRTRNNALIENIREKYIYHDMTVPVYFHFHAEKGKRAVLTAKTEISGDAGRSSGKGRYSRKSTAPEGSKGQSTVSVMVLSPEPVEKAEKDPVRAERIMKILSQTGGTVWKTSGIKADIDGELFIPVSAVKKMRRKALEKLEEEILKLSRRKNIHTYNAAGEKEVKKVYAHNATEKKEEKIAHAHNATEKKEEKTAHAHYAAGEKEEKAGHAHYATGEKKEKAGYTYNGADKNEEYAGQNELAGTLCVRVLTREQFSAALKSYAVSDIFIRPEILEPRQIIQMAAEGRTAGKNIYFVMPRVFKPRTKRLILKNYSDIFSDKNITGFLACTFDQAEFIRNTFDITPERIVLDHTVYAVNSQACRLYMECGYMRMMTSYEEDPGQIMEIPYEIRKNMIGTAGGAVPVMVSDICVYDNLYGCGRKNLTNDTVIRSIEHSQYSSDVLRVKSFCRFCYNEISMKDPANIEQRIRILNKAGIKSFMINISDDDPDKAAKMIKDAAALINDGRSCIKTAFSGADASAWRI